LNKYVKKTFIYSVKAPAGKSKTGTLPVEIILAQLPNSERRKDAGIENGFFITKTKLYIALVQQQNGCTA
jgi:hypothetical protein